MWKWAKCLKITCKICEVAWKDVCLGIGRSTGTRNKQKVMKSVRLYIQHSSGVGWKVVSSKSTIDT